MKVQTIELTRFIADNLTQMSDIASFYSEVAGQIDEVLDRLLPAADVDPTRLHEAMRWSVFAGGKRFRPALTMAVGRAFGVDDVRLLNTAAAIEMIHTFSLIHDDLPAMDDDNMRRGKETCHVRFDESTAIIGTCVEQGGFSAVAQANNTALQRHERLKV